MVGPTMALRMPSLGRCLLGARRLSPLHLKVPKNQNSDTSVNYTCNTLSHCNSNASHPVPIFVHFQGCQYLSTSSATQHARSQLPVGVIKPDEESKIFRWATFYPLVNIPAPVEKKNETLSFTQVPLAQCNNT